MVRKESKVKNIFIWVFNQLDAQNLFHNKFYLMPLHVSSTCAHHQVVIGGRLVHQTATYRYDDTRGCVMQFWPPDDEHMVFETCRGMKWNLLWNEFCASSWLNTEINVLRCSTVSKTSKKNLKNKIGQTMDFRRNLTVAHWLLKIKLVNCSTKFRHITKSYMSAKYYNLN